MHNTNQSAEGKNKLKKIHYRSQNQTPPLSIQKKAHKDPDAKKQSRMAKKQKPTKQIRRPVKSEEKRKPKKEVYLIVLKITTLSFAFAVEKKREHPLTL